MSWIVRRNSFTTETAPGWKHSKLVEVKEYIIFGFLYFKRTRDYR